MTGQATGEPLNVPQPHLLRLQASPPPAPQRLWSPDTCTQRKTQWEHGGEQASSWRWLGTFFPSSGLCWAHCRAQGSPRWTAPQPHIGRGQAGGCRYRAGQAAVLLPLLGSTLTKGTKIGAHTYGSVMLLNIFTAAHLGSNARFKHAAGAGWMGTVALSLGAGLLLSLPRVAALVQEAQHWPWRVLHSEVRSPSDCQSCRRKQV